jgi:carbon monoxide dehydrogenase subunit G
MGKTHQSTVIEAPIRRVWDAVRNFHDMSWAANVVTSLETIGDRQGDEVGAIRILNGAFHETLRELDDANHTFAYSIDDGPSPLSKSEVRDYVGRVRVQESPDGHGTLVEWSSKWLENDEAVYEFCHPLYVALLADMKASLEQA